MYQDIELTKEREGRTLKHAERPTPDQSTSVPSLRDSSVEMEEEDLEAIPIDRPRNPPTNEEALESLGCTLTEADLGPHSPASCPSSLVPYGVGEDSSTEEDQAKGAEAMDTDGQSTAELKEGMGIRIAPLAYQPTSPKYMCDNDEENAGEDSSSDEDVEAQFLAPRDAPTTRTLDDIKTAFYSIKKAASEAKSIAASSGDESVPDLIGLHEEASTPPSLPPKKATHPKTFGLDRKTVAPTKEPVLPLSAQSKGRSGKTTGTGPQIVKHCVPKEEIIYKDDDREPSPLALLQQ